MHCDEGFHEDSNWKARRLELPSFNGLDVDDWILKVEKYFSYYQLSDKQKMEVSVVCLEGEAMMWCKYANQRLPMRRWEDLKNLILERFRPFKDGDLYEQWMSVEQTGYRREFVTRLNYVDMVDEPVMIGAFLRGLCEEVKIELKLMGPTTLDQAMDWAERIDRKLECPSWMGRRRQEQGRNYPLTIYKNQNMPKYPNQPQFNPNPNSCDITLTLTLNPKLIPTPNIPDSIINPTQT